jgi:hypothetical protein
MKLLKKITIGLLSLVVLFFATLAIHIYMVLPAPKVNSDARVRQLSRIDFNQQIDSAEAQKIQGFVANMEGIESTYFNVPDNVLVYTYTVGKQNSDVVYNKLMAFGKYNAQKYVVTTQQASTGCPIDTKEKTFTGMFSAYMAHIFN